MARGLSRYRRRETTAATALRANADRRAPALDETTRGGAGRRLTSGRTVASRVRGAAFVGVFAAFVSYGAMAELVGTFADRSYPGMSESERALIDANPILRQLVGEHPEALREVLGRLQEGLPPRGSRSLVSPPTESARKPAAGSEENVFVENPDLGALHRESPEAALDLLRLIREAAKRK